MVDQYGKPPEFEHVTIRNAEIRDRGIAMRTGTIEAWVSGDKDNPVLELSVLRDSRSKIGIAASLNSKGELLGISPEDGKERRLDRYLWARQAIENPAFVKEAKAFGLTDEAINRMLTGVNKGIRENAPLPGLRKSSLAPS